MTRTVFYAEGETLVLLTDDRKVQSFRKTQSDEQAVLTEWMADQPGDVVFTGTSEEVTAVLAFFRDEYDGDEAAVAPRTLVAGRGTVLAAGVSTFALCLGLAYGLGSWTHPRLPWSASIPFVASTTPLAPADPRSQAAVATGAPQATAASGQGTASPAPVATAPEASPAVVATAMPGSAYPSDKAPTDVPDPSDDEAAAAQMGGNGLQPGSVSPHGATGAGLADAKARAALAAKRKVPDQARMPPLPSPIAALAQPASQAAQPPQVAAPKAMTPPRPGAFTVAVQSNGSPRVPQSPEQARSEALATGGAIPLKPGQTPEAARAATMPQAPAPQAPAPQEAVADATKPTPVATPAASSAPTAPDTTPASADAGPQVVAPLADMAKEVRAKTATEQAAARDTVKEKGAEASKAEVAKLMSVLDNLKNGDKLPPEIVRDLPHELARTLTEKGAVETPEETAARLAGATGKASFTIVHLPAGTLGHYLDKDGVPTIPGGDSWAATGGNVVIPLPGGGEIRKPSDLALFHLQG